MNDAQFKEIEENFQSEILRGISTLSILMIIKAHGSEGVYGYVLIQELKEKTKSKQSGQEILVIEEGTLYPMLKKLNESGLISKQSRVESSRNRIYYYLTPLGLEVVNHMTGFLTKLIEAISPLIDIGIQTEQDHFMYCPNCANKIDITEGSVKFCVVCGYDIANRMEDSN
jgi:PadR family transcriptional regulator PadR